MVVVEALISVTWPFFLREVLDTAIPQGRVGLLTLLTGGMVLAAASANVLGVCQALLSNRAGHQVMHKLRTTVYGRVQSMPMGFFTRARSGEVQSRLTHDIAGMETTLTTTMTALVSNATSVFATLVAMAVLDWRLTLFVVPFLALFVWISRRVGDDRRSLTGERQRQMAHMTGIIAESLSVGGVLLGRTMGRNPSLLEEFRAVSGRLAEIDVHAATSGAWRMSGIGVMLASAPPLLYWAAGMMTHADGVVPTVGTLVAFVTLQQALVWPTNELLTTGVQVQSSLALFQRIFEYLDLENTLAERRTPKVLPAPRGDVRFERVTFGYGTDGTACLTDVDLTVPAGSHLAVVGPTGSGKTTLGYLLARIHDADSGRITLDGEDVRDLSFDCLAACVGVVSQDPFFYNDTIGNNLRFAKPDARDEDLHRAARTAQIHEFVQSLPDGYDTMLGERGYRLSGGEKQRLALARTILRDPPVILLDEATSALDGATEAAVQTALSVLPSNPTRISIAHRLSTVRDADQIVVLEGGRVVEYGRHEELLAAGGTYAGLVRAGDARVETVSP